MDLPFTLVACIAVGPATISTRASTPPVFHLDSGFARVCRGNDPARAAALEGHQGRWRSLIPPTGRQSDASNGSPSRWALPRRRLRLSAGIGVPARESPRSAAGMDQFPLAQTGCGGARGGLHRAVRIGTRPGALRRLPEILRPLRVAAAGCLCYPFAIDFSGACGARGPVRGGCGGPAGSDCSASARQAGARKRINRPDFAGSIPGYTRRGRQDKWKSKYWV